jgi:hypothetical protein
MRAPWRRPARTRGWSVTMCKPSSMRQHHLIVAHEVTNIGNDRSQLSTMAKQAQEATGVRELTVMHTAGRRSSLVDGGAQGRQRQPDIDRAGDGVSDDLARPGRALRAAVARDFDSRQRRRADSNLVPPASAIEPDLLHDGERSRREPRRVCHEAMHDPQPIAGSRAGSGRSQTACPDGRAPGLCRYP